MGAAFRYELELEFCDLWTVCWAAAVVVVLLVVVVVKSRGGG